LINSFLGKNGNLLLIGLFGFVLTTGLVSSQQAFAASIIIDDLEDPASGSFCNGVAELLIDSPFGGTDTGVSGVLGNVRACNATLQVSGSPGQFEIEIVNIWKYCKFQRVVFLMENLLFSITS